MPSKIFIRVENVNDHPWNIYRKNYEDKAFIAECLDIKVTIERIDYGDLRKEMETFSVSRSA